MNFHDLGLSTRLLGAVTAAGYEEPTPIQSKVIPHVLQGRDILASAQTGSGKTAAFLLPLIDMMEKRMARQRMPRALILEPTRELAAQVQEVFTILGSAHDLEQSLLIGGEAMGKQRNELARAPDVIVATPGRLMDHCERGAVLLSDTQYLILDEADRMLDMGFLPDIQRIMRFLPKKRQTLLFSATFPDDIIALSQEFMTDIKKVSAAPPSSASGDVKHHLAMVTPREKSKVMVELVRSVAPSIERGIVFCNRKRDILDLMRQLRQGLKATDIAVGELHGDMDQKARSATLEAFRAGELRLLVASDVVARGIDVKGVSHIFLNDVPYNAESYIHRSGRTGRAGAQGFAYTLATSKDEQALVAIKELLARGKQHFHSIEKGSALLSKEKEKVKEKEKEKEQEKEKEPQEFKKPQEKAPKRQRRTESPSKSELPAFLRNDN